MYNAFLSYSHAADARLAPTLQVAVQRFAKPWNRLRALRIFRDESSLSTNPALWASIEAALRESQFFILLASPTAAQSPWVEREIRWWCTERTPDRLLIVVTEGAVAWDDATRDFDWSRTNAIPPALRGAFKGEPHYLDLGWARLEPELSPRHPRFQDAVAELAATLHERPKDELIGDDVRQHQKTRRLVRAAVTVLALLTVTAGTFAYFAYRNERRANRQRMLLVAQALAGEAARVRAEEPGHDERAALLAVEAYRIDSEYHGDRPQVIEAALRQVLSAQHFTAPLAATKTPFRSLAVSTNGRWIAAGNEDGRIWVWDRTARRRAPRVAAQPSGAVWSLAFRPGRGELAVGTHDGEVRLWDVEGPDSAMHTLGPVRPGARIRSLAFDPDGSHLVVGAEDSVLRVWSVDARGEEPNLLCCHRGRVSAVAFGRNSFTIASGASDGTVRVWDLRRPTQSALILRSPDNGITALAITPDGAALAAGTAREIRLKLSGLAALSANEAISPSSLASGGTVVMWDLHKRAPTPLILGQHGSTVQAVAVSPDGKVLASAGADREIRLWRRRPPYDLAVLQGHEAPVEAVAFAPDGRWLASAGEDGTVRVWERESPAGLPVRLEGHSDVVAALAFSATGDTLASAGSGDHSAKLWDPDRSVTALTTLEHGDSSVQTVAFAPVGGWFATGTKGPIGSGPGNGVRLWRGVRAGAATFHLRGFASGVRFLAFSGDGTRLAAAGEFDQEIRLFRLSESPVLDTIVSTVPNDVTGVAFSPQGRILAWGTSAGAIRLWDIDGAKAAERPGHAPAAVRTVAFAPDGARLISGGEDGTVKVWPLRASRGAAVTFRGHSGPVLAVAIDPEGATVASGGSDQTVRFWKLEDPAAKPIQLKVPWTVRAIAFSVTGRWVAVAGDADSIVVWRRAAALVENACSLVERDTLTQQEWQYFIGADIRRRPSCGSRRLGGG